MPPRPLRGPTALLRPRDNVQLLEAMSSLSSFSFRVSHEKGTFSREKKSDFLFFYQYSYSVKSVKFPYFGPYTQCQFWNPPVNSSYCQITFYFYNPGFTKRFWVPMRSKFARWTKSLIMCKVYSFTSEWIFGNERKLKFSVWSSRNQK